MTVLQDIEMIKKIGYLSEKYFYQGKRRNGRYQESDAKLFWKKTHYDNHNDAAPDNSRVYYETNMTSDPERVYSPYKQDES